MKFFTTLSFALVISLFLGSCASKTSPTSKRRDIASSDLKYEVKEIHYAESLEMHNYIQVETDESYPDYGTYLGNHQLAILIEDNFNLDDADIFSDLSEKNPNIAYPPNPKGGNFMCRPLHGNIKDGVSIAYHYEIETSDNDVNIKWVDNLGKTLRVIRYPKGMELKGFVKDKKGAVQIINLDFMGVIERCLSYNEAFKDFPIEHFNLLLRFKDQNGKNWITSEKNIALLRSVNLSSNLTVLGQGKSKETSMADAMKNARDVCFEMEKTLAKKIISSETGSTSSDVMFRPSYYSKVLFKCE